MFIDTRLCIFHNHMSDIKWKREFAFLNITHDFWVIASNQVYSFSNILKQNILVYSSSSCFSPAVVDTLHMPPTPPSSHGSDSEGGQSPSRSLPPSSPTHLQATVKVTSRTASALTNSPLLTAPHVRDSGFCLFLLSIAFCLNYLGTLIDIKTFVMEIMICPI